MSKLEIIDLPMEKENDILFYMHLPLKQVKNGLKNIKLLMITLQIY